VLARWRALRRSQPEPAAPPLGPQTPPTEAAAAAAAVQAPDGQRLAPEGSIREVREPLLALALLADTRGLARLTPIQQQQRQTRWAECLQGTPAQ
jgi:hypothetical protein